MVLKFWKWFTGRASIRKKLSISFALLVSIPIITLGVYSFSVSNRNLFEQTEKTMDNNVDRLQIEMDDRFQRENDFTKYLAYNLSFREALESHPYDSVAIAQTLNKTVEPILWYFITSDINIKRIQIITPYVERPIGSFLEPAGDYEGEAWYRRHKTEFNTVWSVEAGRLYAARTILDTATTSRPIGVMRMEFFLNRLLEPVSSMDYLDNGIIVLDAGGKLIYEKAAGDEEIAEAVYKQIQGMEGGGEFITKQYILKSAVLGSTGWQLYYYIDRSKISDQAASIITSTLVVVSACIVVIFIFISIFSKTLSSRILLLKGRAEEISGGNLENPCFTEDTDEIGVVTNSLGHMTERLNNTINQVYKIEIERKASELKALQAMINPHFLYNCLSSIKWKALKKGDEEISDITGLIAKFYRLALNNGKQITSVGSELENIRAYVEIQMLTHNQSFEVEYVLEEEGMEYPMLNFLLQPIVENAIKHGIDYREEESGKGKIKIEFLQEGQFLVFHIYNNGPVMNVAMLESILNRPGKGYGIFNIQERIALFYGEECGLSASVTEDECTCFTVRIFKAAACLDV